MKTLTALLAAASVSLAAQTANADNDIRESRIESRLENPHTYTDDGQPELFSLTPSATLYGGINGIELNHQQIGYGVGGKLNLHIGAFSAELGDAEDDSDNMFFGIDVSDSFTAIITGGIYDGFVAQQTIGLSGNVLNSEVGGGFFAGAGISFVGTYDPWLNLDFAAYGNVHAGGRLIFKEWGQLELEAGALFNEDDSGWYTSLAFGVNFPFNF
ncbi:MAG: hypothetical protein PHO02_04780 [Candidatus Nanoarchaeia archaeon]|nr:hypothetical protein [Candidatus Nanoarchaeia archaeon]